VRQRETGEGKWREGSREQVGRRDRRGEGSRGKVGRGEGEESDAFMWLQKQSDHILLLVLPCKLVGCSCLLSCLKLFSFQNLSNKPVVRFNRVQKGIRDPNGGLMVMWPRQLL